MASGKGGLSVATLLVLVAAIAAGLAVTRTLPGFLVLNEDRNIVDEHYPSPTGGSWRSYSVGFPSSNLSRSPGLSSRRRASYWLDHVPYWSGPCLVSLTFATMLLRLRRPRPTRRVARRPGRVVGLAVVVAMAIKFVECLVWSVAWWRSLTAPWNPAWPWQNVADGPWAYFWLTVPVPAALGVAFGWMALALGGRRPPAPDAVERLGRAIGWAWIALALSRAAGSWCLALGY